MKIVVTGGAGFIGSHLIDRLLIEGNTVINIDNFDPFYSEKVKRQNIKGHFDYNTYSLIEVDIRDKGKLSKIIPSDTDVIVHLAAKAGVRPSIMNPTEYQEVNVTGTQNLLEIAREKEVKQFVFASSSSVYGKNPNVPWNEDDHVLMPISPYASSKVSGELLGHVYSHLFGIRFIALRFFTVYGARQRPDLAIHKFFNLILSNSEIAIYGDGSTRRDYTFIDDIVSGIIKSIYYDKSLFEVINLGNNKTVRLSELINEIEQVNGSVIQKRHEPEQPGDVKQTWANIAKAKSMLGYSPDYSLKKGLLAFKEWHENINEVVK